MSPVEAESSSVGGPIAWLARNSVAANLMMAVLLVGGVLGLLRTKQEVFPEFDLDFINVVVAYPGASPTEVEQGIVLVTEEAVRAVDGVKRVTSVSSEGAGVVNLELQLSADADKVLADVKAEVDRITSYPQEAERPMVTLVTRKREVISLLIAGDEPLSTLHRIAEQARADLMDHADITQVEVFGVPATELSVEIPRATLESLRTGLDDVARAVTAGSLELPGGEIDTPAGSVLVRVSDRRVDGPGMRDLALRATRTGDEVALGDVAAIKDGYEDDDLRYVLDGKRAVRVTAYRVADETPIKVANAVRAYADTLRASLPSTMSVRVWADDSLILKDRIRLLVSNALQGLLLVLLILALFLDVRLALWVALGIPTSFLGMFALMPSLDLSVNMITLFAFIITLGMVVDDAIIVGEAAFVKRQHGSPPLAAAIAGAREMAVPVTFAILTSLAAFSPLFFVPGTMGKVFQFIPYVVIGILVVSLFESFAILPAHLAHLSSEPPAWARPFARVQGVVDRGLTAFSAKLYRPFLERALAVRYTTLAVAIATLVVTIGLVAGGVVPFSFFPDLEGDVVTVTARLPVGAPAAQTEVARQALEDGAHAARAELGESFVVGMFTRVGEGPPAGGPAPVQERGGHIVSVEINLVPSGERSFTSETFASAWRKATAAIPGVESVVFNASSGPGAGAAVDVQLRHRDTEVLARASDDVARTLATFSELTNIENAYAGGKARLDVKMLPHARALGLTPFDVARQLRASFFGAEAVREQRGRDELKIMVRLPEGERESEQDLDDLRVKTPQGALVPLSTIALVTRSRAPTEIRREDGSRIVNVTAKLAAGVASPQPILDELRSTVIAEWKGRYEGLEVSLVGAQRAQSEAFASLGQNFLFALFVIFALLAVPFRSYLQPLIVMSAIPFGIVGAVLGHLLLGFEMSIISMMGIVALAGVAVNDSLVLIDAANVKRKEGIGALASVVWAGTRRLRPILLTSLTTFFGLMPMIFETSVQARFLIPMAISLGFGVLFATVIALVIVPALYMVLEDARAILGVPDPRDRALADPDAEARLQADLARAAAVRED